MNKATKLALAGGIAAIAVIAPEQAQAAQTSGTQETGTITATSLYVRKEPSTQASILGSLKQGETIEILAKENGWAKVSYNGGVGYVSLEYVRTTAASSSSTNVATKETAKVTATTLNVRQTPAITGVIADRIQQGQAVQIISKENGWARIEYDGKQGYVSLQYLQIDATVTVTANAVQIGTVNATKLNLRQTPSTTGAIIGSIAKGEAVTIVSQENDWVKVNYNGKQGYVAAAYISISSGGSTVSAPAQTTPVTETQTSTTPTTGTSIELGTVTVASLNIRESPATTGTIVGTLKQGESVGIINKENGWATIEYKGGQAYVSLSYIQLQAAPVVEEAATEEAATVTASVLNVRKDPSLQGAVVGTLKQGETVTVLSKENGWAMISYNGGTAYTSLQYLQAQSNSQEQASEQRTVAAAEVEVKEQASYSAKVLGTLKQGTTVNVITTEGDWVKIQYNGKEAYIQSLAFEQATQEEYGTVTATSLNVRAAPSSGAALVGKLQKGDMILVLSKENGWAKVSYNGAVAYVSLDYVTTGVQSSTYMVVTASGKFMQTGWAASSQALASLAEDGYVTRDGKVVNMKKGFVRTKASGVVSIYDRSTNKQLTYVAPNTDIQFVASEENRTIVSIDGITGYVSRADVTLYPTLVQEPTSYYTVKAGKLFYYAYSISSKTYYSYETGYAPAHLQEGVKYEAFNKTAIGDRDSYQYFQYVSLRSKANYTAQEIDSFLRANRSNSPLIGTGASFIAAADKYKINVGYLLAHAVVESAWGTSNIAQNKHNLFGFQAVDSNPYGGAASFATFAEGIDYCAQYISKQYLNPSGNMYNGAILGDKARGMNVMYASDSNWGQSIASVMHKLDKMYGNRSLNQYQLGMVQEGAAVFTAVGGTQVGTVQKNTIVTIKRTVQTGQGAYYELVSDNSSYDSVYIKASYVKSIASY